MSAQFGFIGEWWVATIIGVLIGTFLGADKIGLVQHVPGDFLFGLTIGIAQFPVLYRHLPKHNNRSWMWVVASAVAFPISVSLGRRTVSVLSPGPNLTLMNLCFGIGMGIGHGVLQAVAIRFILPSLGWRFLIWIPVALIAWILAEVISLGADYIMILAIPVGLILGIVEAIGWRTILKPNHQQQAAVSTSFRTTDQSSG